MVDGVNPTAIARSSVTSVCQLQLVPSSLPRNRSSLCPPCLRGENLLCPVTRDPVGIRGNRRNLRMKTSLGATDSADFPKQGRRGGVADLEGGIPGGEHLKESHLTQSRKDAEPDKTEARPSEKHWIRAASLLTFLPSQVPSPASRRPCVREIWLRPKAGPGFAAFLRSSQVVARSP